MKQKVVPFAIASLILGSLGSYGAGYMQYEPRVRAYEAQLAGLTAEISNLNQTVAGQETRISGLTAEKTGLQQRLGYAEAQSRDYEKQLRGARADLSSVRARLDSTLRTTVTQYYTWTYRSSSWTWDLPIPLSAYVEFKERPRPRTPAYFVDMARDSADDLYISQMVAKINDAALKQGFSEIEKLNFVVAFVQSLPYTVDNVTTPFDEYPRYPIETLFDRGGDCEDTSILAAALIERLGYDVAILVLPGARHAAVGVSLAGVAGTYYEYGGKKYFYLETTGAGWAIGTMPPSITSTSANVYPLGR